MKNLIKVNSVKEFRNNRINIRRKTCPTTFINKNNSKCDLINKEIKSLELLSGIIKSYQIEFLSSKKFDNNYNVLIKSLINFKNTLNKSLKEHYEEQNYLYLKNLNTMKTIAETNVDNKKKIFEINQIKDLNFQIKNEIDKINNINKKLTVNINYLKTIDLFQEEIKEIYVKNSNEILSAEIELKNELNTLRSKYNYLNTKIKEDEKEINVLNNKLEKVKNILLNENFYKKYIDSDNIINETSENKEISLFNKSNSNGFDSKRNECKFLEESIDRKVKNIPLKSIINNENNFINMNIDINFDLNNTKKKIYSIEKKNFEKIHIGIKNKQLNKFNNAGLINEENFKF